MAFLKKNLKRIEGLRYQPRGQGAWRDFRHAAEELGEISKALRRIEEGDSDMDNLREEAVDLAICAMSIFVGATDLEGKAMTECFAEIFSTKLDKWEKNKKE